MTTARRVWISLGAIGLVVVGVIAGAYWRFYRLPYSHENRVVQRMMPYIEPGELRPGTDREAYTLREIRRALWAAAANRVYFDGTHAQADRVNALADELQRTQGAPLQTVPGAWRFVERLEAVSPRLHEYAWVVQLREAAAAGEIIPPPATKK